MTEPVRITLIVAVLFLLWQGVSAQQVKQEQKEKATVEERLAETEKRLDSLEKAVDTTIRPAAGMPDGAFETRMIRLESRLDRLEAQSIRQPLGASGNMLESRVRMLEQQVARLSR